MKNRALALTAVVLTLSSTPVVLAANNSQTPSEKVWVAQDVTRQDNYLLHYKHYDANHNLVSEEDVIPPTGALVVYKQVPLAEALAKHENYVPVDTSGPDLQTKLEDLHVSLFHDLHGKNATMDSVMQSNTIQPMTTPPGTSTGVAGTFTDYKGSTYWYDINFDTMTPGYINVGNYYYEEQVGTIVAYLDHLTWDGVTRTFNGLIMPTSGNPNSLYLGWKEPPGYAFTTYVKEYDGTMYSGWVTLS